MQALWMLLASFLFAVMAALVKLCAADVGAMALVAWRGVFGVVLLGGWAYLRGQTVRSPHVWGHFRRSAYGSLALCLWFYAVARLPLSTGMTLNYTSPIFMAFLGIVLALLHRRSAPWFLGAMALVGFAGVLLILRPEVVGLNFPAAVSGLLSGLLSAIAFMEIRDLASTGEPELKIVFWFVASNIPFGLAGHWLFETSSAYTLTDWGLVCLVGITATLAQAAMTKSFSSGNAVLSCLFGYSGILFSCLLGAMFYGETFPWQSIVGTAVIIGSGVAASLHTARTGRSAPSLREPKGS